MKRRTMVALFVVGLLIVSGCDALRGLTPPDAGPLPAGPGASGVEERIDGYLAVAPRVLRPGQAETLAVSIFQGDMPASGTVRVALLKDGREVGGAAAYVRERGEVRLDVPRLADGDYQLQLLGNGLKAESTVKVEEGALIFLETDKPIYKPGQTVHIRVLTLDGQLRPVTLPVTVEVMDAKGLKVFKRETTSDDYGIATLDLPLSTEPNLGVWKIAAGSGKRTAQIDVRVERYVLPKYEVKVDMPREWVLASDQITGTVSAEYSYGKAVSGEVQLRALRYVGSWQEFANVTRTLDGKVDFQLPAVRYVSGVPGQGGMGNVQLEVTVREKSTGYEEKTTRLLTVAPTPLILKVIPESVSFKPNLPLSLLFTAETPDKKPLDASVQLNLVWTKKDFKVSPETRQVQVKGGRAILQVTAPEDAISMSLNANSSGASTSLAMQSNYSPSGSFIHLGQMTQGPLKVGDSARFHVSSTKEAANFYYEVLSRGKVIFSDFSKSPDFQFTITPAMAPSSRLLIYQLLPNSEVAADYLPFAVQGEYPQRVQASFSQEEAKPGEQVEVRLQTEGTAKVGLAAVDRSVFILAENRLNLQQVFDELEKLYQKPQAELHEARPMDKLMSRGAKDVFDDAGVVVISNKKLPAGQEYESPMRKFGGAAVGPLAGAPARAAAPVAALAPTQAAGLATDSAAAGGLKEVQRIRQFFPETWIWDTVTTDQSGKGSKRYETPDSITTWMLHAVALSKQTGLGISEAQIKVMQPFFVTVDLPYSVIRSERFPVKVALYNYQASEEEFTVELEQGDWFRMLDDTTKSVKVGPNGLGAATFTIQTTRLGTNKVKVIARSRSSSDAIVKELIVEPEGVARESVENAVLAGGTSRQMDMAVPDRIIEGSARATVSLTGSYLTQTIQGLEKLLQMPFGCGEQNMILLAPNIFVSRYLKETNQLKPEVMAKAEQLMMTGYQRELTYRRNDGSFSAFGNQDKEGSLWLTAFVLKSFSQAKGLIFIDDSVLASAQAWIAKHQNADGSFDPVGFVAHQELLGGLKGKTALTAYVAVALREAGEQAASAKAIRYLEGAIENTGEAYGVALATYALELAKSPKAGVAYDKLMGMAQQTEDGLYWGDVEPMPLRPDPIARPAAAAPGIGAPVAPGILPRPNHTATIETTGYATLALIEHGDKLSASRSARWLVSKRNAYGGFGSTQDTVVGLQAMTKYAADARSDVDATVILKSAAWQKEIKVQQDNADVLQSVEVPLGAPVSVEVRGRGQVVVQAVRRFNVPDHTKKSESIFAMQVDYGVGQVEVNDLIDVRASISFNPPEPMQAGMVVMDVAVPTGFAPVVDTLDALAKGNPKIKRYDVAGRKVIVYIEDMAPGEQTSFTFKARALYPVKAQAVASQAYSYYRPEWSGEFLGGATEVR